MPNIKTGTQAEVFVAQELSIRGAWVGDFNKSNTGSQPFDQVAITSNYTWCYDVKHCNVDRFDFVRVEDNQRLSLSYIHGLDNVNVIVGFTLVYKEEIFFLTYYNLLQLIAEGRKSIKITSLENMFDLLERLDE